MQIAGYSARQNPKSKQAANPCTHMHRARRSLHLAIEINRIKIKIRNQSSRTCCKVRGEWGFNSGRRVCGNIDVDD